MFRIDRHFVAVQVQARDAEASGDMDGAYNFHMEAIGYINKGYYTFRSKIYEVENGKPPSELDAKLCEYFDKAKELQGSSTYLSRFGYGED